MTLHPLLDQSPDICGGDVRVQGTRITARAVAQMAADGYSADEINDMYPHSTVPITDEVVSACRAWWRAQPATVPY